jgi:general secretion pathway protein L
VLREHGFDPGRCVIDHNNEETIEEVLERGFWTAFSIYPGTKMGNVRLAELVLRYGSDRIIVDSACDWGVSDPLAIPKTARLMMQRGISAEHIRKVTYDNALSVYGLNGEMTQLPSGHVMACPLDFPAQAGDFLDGMIRAQIDRLTPWTVHDAIFGWTPPVTAANERIEVTFAATSKSKVEPLLQFVQSQAVSSVAIYSTVSAGAGPAARIKLLEQSLQSTIGSTVSLPRLLRGALLATGIAAAASLLVAAYLENSMQSEQSELQRQISQRRAALRLDPNATGSGLGLLAKRKQTTPSSIMVMEAISRALPDTTYVTELRIEGDKVQVVGMTQDAPSLIKLMEQSPQFTRATFFAPTTRAANEPGERFHIEAHITAYFGSGT